MGVASAARIANGTSAGSEDEVTLGEARGCGGGERDECGVVNETVVEATIQTRLQSVNGESVAAMERKRRRRWKSRQMRTAHVGYANTPDEPAERMSRGGRVCDRDAGRRFASDECRKRDERPGRPRGPSRPRKRGSLTCAGEGEEIASFSSGVPW